MMSGTNGSNGTPLNSDAANTPPPLPAQRRSPWPLVVVAALFIIVPFFAWYGTWFGRALDDDDIEKYLSDDEKPRHSQHALSQIAERISKGDRSVARWHPQIVKLAGSQVADVRMTAAWVMGVEHESGEFHSALLRLLEDPETIVRRNAALALVRFGDARARPVLLSMLGPQQVKAPVGGTLLTVLSAGANVKRDSLVARVETGDGKTSEVRAPLPGKIKGAAREGEQVSAGQEILTLGPDPEQARDALVGLYYFGEAEDLPLLEDYARGVEGMPADIRQQAAQTVEAVKRRSSQKQ